MRYWGAEFGAAKSMADLVLFGAVGIATLSPSAVSRPLMRLRGPPGAIHAPVLIGTGTSRVPPLAGVEP